MEQIFQVIARDKRTKARIGRLTTAHGLVETPTFLPDATYGAVKHLSAEELRLIGLQMILGNAYHLGLRPGADLIKKLGGLGEFMGWDRPILTDSGGWQAFSLVYLHKLGRVIEGGIHFRDQLAGTAHFLTPERSIRQQLDLGADVLMSFDYPISPADTGKENERSVRLTVNWAKAGREYFEKQKDSKGKILLAIIQGANDRKMRRRCYEELEAVSAFSGYGFGGVPENEEILEYTAGLIPDDRLRYVMGCGTPVQIIKAVGMGWDLFDCVVPTRNARHGVAYTFCGEIKILQGCYRTDKKPIEAGCDCAACRAYSRAYIRHLLKVGEPLGQRLMTIHNLRFYMRLMGRIKKAVLTGKFDLFQREFYKYII